MKIVLQLVYVLVLQVIEFVLWGVQRFRGYTAANGVYFTHGAALSGRSHESRKDHQLVKTVLSSVFPY